MPGDQVCILFGGNTPFVLRPCNEYYQLVGECYIHGMMDGEAMAFSNDGRVKLQEFVLR